MALPGSTPPQSSADSARVRLQVELTPVLVSLLDHVATITGATRAGIAVQALTEILPQLVERADAMKKRAGEVARASHPGGGKGK